MASKRFEVDIALNAGDVAKGAADGEKALKKLEDAVTDAGKGGARDLDQLEDGLKDVQRQAGRAEKAVDDIGTTGHRSLDKVKGGAHEVQQEFGQNLGEAVSSLRGDLSDLGQVGQDTLGGLAGTVAGMGPAGLLGAFALAAGAAGLGAITAGIEDAKQKQEEMNQAAADWAEAYQESAGKIVSSASVVAGVNAIATDPDRYKTASDNAKNWGVDVSAAMLAMAGDATALGTVQESLTAKQRDYNAEVETFTQRGTAGLVQGTGHLTEAQKQTREEILKGTEALDAQTQAMAMGRQQAENAAGALYAYALNVGTATGAIDGLGNAVYKLPDGKEIVIDAQTKKAYEDLDAVEQRRVADKEFIVKARVDDSDVYAWRAPMKEGVVQYKPRAGGMLADIWE